MKNKVFMTLCIILLLFIINSSKVLAKEINQPEDCLWGDISIRGRPTCNNLIDDNIALERRNIECKITLKSGDVLDINASSMTLYLEMRAKSSINEKWVLYDQTAIRNGELIKESELWNETNSIIFLNEPVPWTIEWRIACVNETDENYLESVEKTIYVQPASVFKDLEYSKTLQNLYKEQLEGQEYSMIIQVLGALGGAIIGGIAVFLGSFYLQNRGWKKRRSVELVKTLYGPLYDKLEEIKEEIEREEYLSYQYYLKWWDDLTKSHKILLLDDNLTRKLKNIIEKINEYHQKGFKQNNYGEMDRDNTKNLDEEKKLLKIIIDETLFMIKKKIT